MFTYYAPSTFTWLSLYHCTIIRCGLRVCKSVKPSMPKVITHTPSWLSGPSPGFDFFQPGPQTKTPLALTNGQGRKIDQTGPSRTIAHRGTEVFAVVGNEIRWSDLILLRDTAKDQGNDSGSGQDQTTFRVRPGCSSTHVVLSRA